MTIEFLGVESAHIGGESVDVPVFVAWVDFQDRTLLDQLVIPVPCPRCDFPLNIGPMFADPAIASIAVTCANCQARTHFDRTPKAERVHLRWLRGFKKD